MTMRTVTRADLCEVVYQKVGLSRSECAVLVELVLTEIMDCLERGETVKLSSFGSFAVRKLSALRCRLLVFPIIMASPRICYDVQGGNGPTKMLVRQRRPQRMQECFAQMFHSAPSRSQTYPSSRSSNRGRYDRSWPQAP